jgi:AcrR family transcriptional regulator
MLPSDNLIAAANIQPAPLVHGPIGVALSPSLRERLTQAAYPLFARRGIKDVTLEEIERAAGVAGEELAAVYSCRDEAAADFLARRSRDWTIGMIEAGARKRGTTPEERLLAIFDVFDDWFHRDDFEACSFINVLLEMGAAHPLGKASIEYLVHIRQIVTTLAEEANLCEPAEFARSWHILMKGSIISASEGDVHAAKRSKKMARALIREHRSIICAEPERTAGGSIAPTAGDTGEDTKEDNTEEGWTEWDNLFPTRKVIGTPAAVNSQDIGFGFDYEYDLH